VNYVEHHFGDYAKDTRHLSIMEHGAYRLLLDLYYVREKPIPTDCFRLVQAKSLAERRAVTNVLSEFFESCESGWRHKRCDSEIERFKEKQAKARASAKFGVEARRKKESAIVERTLSERTSDRSAYPVTSNQTPVTNNQERQKISPAMQAHPIANANGPVDNSEMVLTAEEIPKTNGKAPDCPYAMIAEAYHEELPELPSIVVLSPNRKRALQARWREVCTAEHLNAEQGIRFFRDFFRRIKQSEFLIGKAPPKQQGGRSFRADFDWIINPQNFIKIVEGRYHGRRN